MKTFSTLPLALLATVIAAHGDNRFRLDFDNSSPAPPDNTQSGWEAFSESGDANNKSESYSGYASLAGGNITITSSGVSFTRNYNNSGLSAPDFGGTTLDKVFNDLILRNDDNSAITIEIAGLLAGSYQVTTHHLVSAGSTADTTEFDLDVQDADSPSFGQAVGNFAMGKSDVGPTSPVFTVTSNGTDPILLRLTGTYFNPAGGTLNWMGINGLEITTPAPPFQLDFNHRSAPNHKTQTGWEAFSPTSDAGASGTAAYAGYPGLAGGDITIVTSNMNLARTGNQTDDATVDTVGDGSLDEMYYDLVFRNSDTATPQISIGGLKAGNYRITTYHHITDGGTNKTAFDLDVQDADSPAFGQSVGNFTMGNDVAGPTIVTFDVTSNGTDPVLLRMTANPLGPGGTGNWFGINGLEITIPESSLELSNFTYNPGDGSAEISIKGAANTNYKLVEADDLDFSNPDQDPIPLTGVTVGTQDGNEVTTDGSGNATVQFNLGNAKDATFLRAESAP